MKGIQTRTAGDQRKSDTVPNQPGSGSSSQAASTAAAPTVAGRARDTARRARRTRALTSAVPSSTKRGMASMAEASQTLLSSGPR